MKTLKGYEAIQIAEQHNLALYDLENRAEVSVREAQEYVDRRRDPNVFVIYNWPDTPEEAEQMVLREYQNALLNRRSAEARIFDISIHLSGGLPIHGEAAELAAQRLVQQNKLEVVQAREDGDVYRIPQTMYFKRSFLARLRSKVCPECAHLDTVGAFHEICLMNLVEYIKEIDLSTNDIVEMRMSPPLEHRLPRTIHPSTGVQWLSERASATKQKFKSVLKPIFAPDNEKSDVEAQQNMHDPQETLVIPRRTIVPTNSAASSSITATTIAATVESTVSHGEADASMKPSSSAALDFDWTNRAKITKDELIGYLRKVEIIDEQGELSELRRVRETLLAQLAVKEREIEKAEKQRAYAEKQFQEVQRDMDVLIEALQIAKRRTPNPVTVIDVEDEGEKKETGPSTGGGTGTRQD